jgi:alpha-galactosidase
MGWNSWNTFGGAIHETLIRETADALIATGLLQCGYQYVCIDDLWQGERAADGSPQPDAKKFPNGIKAVADYLHERGMKFGIYSDAGDLTCAGAFGTYGFEGIDARTYAQWGVDYLKYDYCYAPPDRATAIKRYTAMGRALHNCGRPIVYSICEWGGRQPWLWAAQAGGNLWRTTGDIWDSWKDGAIPPQNGIESIGFHSQQGLEAYAGPGRWNDPDMLVVGMNGKGNNSDGIGCTTDEYRTHFSLWCMLAAPLLIGADIRRLSPESLAILSNRELIAINQDALGRQGFCVANQGRVETYLKPLLFGDLAVAVFNRNNTPVSSIALFWSDLSIQGRYLVRDLWRSEDLGVFEGPGTGTLDIALAPHGCQVFRLSPVD